MGLFSSNQKKAVNSVAVPFEKDKAASDSVNIEKATITLRELCNALEVELPKKYENIADEKQTVAMRSRMVKKGDICIIIRSAEDFHTAILTTKDQYKAAIEKGAKLLVMNREAFESNGLNEDDFPVILIDDFNAKIKLFFEKIRKQNNAKVVLLTGSVGKTTTKDFCYTVTKDRFNTYANQKNSNTLHQVAKHAFDNCGRDLDVYIQEAGAGFKGSVRFASEILKPNFFVLTNVYAHHLQIYETMDCLFEDKSSPDDNLADDGIVITNYDDERIRNYNFKHTVKSFAIDYDGADYVARNIRQDIETLRFDIVETATGNSVPMAINILGKYNVYNAMAAYILAKELGSTDDQIAEDFLKYKTYDIRQNFSNVGGIHIDMDCYNSAEESLMGMLKAGEGLTLENGARKIAMLGGENKLGNPINIRRRSKKFGKSIGDIKFDSFAFCGVDSIRTSKLNKYGDAKTISKSFNKVSKTDNQLCFGIDDMINYVKSNVKCGDLLMVKGLYYLDMPVAIDKALGTSYSFGLTHYKDVMTTVRGKNFRANVFEPFGELEIKSCKQNDGELKIPNKIKEYPVFRLKDRAFANSNIESVKFGKSLKNIGKGAFDNCTKLTRLFVPSNVRIIEDGAFGNCASLETVKIANGTIHIGDNAFENCTKLSKVTIPATVGKIGNNAFENCKKCTILGTKNSYAQKYATENGIPFKVVE